MIIRAETAMLILAKPKLRFRNEFIFAKSQEIISVWRLPVYQQQEQVKVN